MAVENAPHSNARGKYVRLKLVGRVAQVVEQRPFKAWVAGSNPAALTTHGPGSPLSSRGLPVLVGNKFACFRHARVTRFPRSSPKEIQIILEVSAFSAREPPVLASGGGN